MPALLFFLYTVLSGLQQGIITWLFRERVEPKFQQWIDAALHWGGILIYALLYFGVLAYELRLLKCACVYVDINYWRVSIELAAVAFLARVLMFDPSLNISRSWFDHREGREWTSPFAVGTSATSDKFIIWQSKKLDFLLSILWKNKRFGLLSGAQKSVNPTSVRFFWWVVCLTLTLLWLFF